VAGNTASTSGPDAIGAVTSLGHNLVGATDGSSGWVGSDLTGSAAAPLNPLLAPLGNYGGPTQTMPLLPGSPALDAGDNALLPAGHTTDQRGLPRAVGGAVDIGAFESQGFTVTLAPGSAPQSAAIGTTFNPLALGVTANNPVEPVDGGVVRFVARPAADGASAIFLNNPAAVIAGGTAAVVAAPNDIPGSYTVVPAVAGFSGGFALTNTGIPVTALTVNTTSDALAPGAGLLSLRDAVFIADAGGISAITFDEQVFATPRTITLTNGPLELSDTGAAISITGPAGGVTISGGGLTRVFQVDAGVNASLSGLTISGGQTTGNGGGLYNDGGTLTLTNCTVSGNSATINVPGSGGGGIASAGGTTTLSHCTISGNSAVRDGGGLFADRGTLTLTNCTVSGNAAGISGGGLFTFGGTYLTARGTTLTLTNCTVSGNVAKYGAGGGIDHLNGTLTVSGSTVSGNSAGFVGGGVLNDGFSRATLTNCTVSDNAARYGGGLFNDGTLALTGCTVSGNAASLNGGGVYVNFGTATLTDCTVSGNSAANGGGGLNLYYGSATLTNCTVSGNAARYGGGLFNDGTLALTGCTVSDNAARYGGGLLSNGKLALTGCTVSGNAASLNGGGVYVNYGTAALTNCTVSGNAAANYGGGLNLWYGSATLTNCTVSGNTAANGGGGLYAFNNQYSVFGQFTLTNTIVAGNTNTSAAASDISGAAAGANNLIGTGGSGGLVNGVNGNLVGVANVLLAPLGNYGGPTQTMPLLPGSPAIDAGASTGAPALDQRGQGRAGAVDIGAFESQGFTLAITSGGGQSTDIATAFAAPLVVTVTANNPVEPVAGGLVTFTPPSSGASAAVGGGPATISAAGTASVTATANGIAGSYTVSAKASGITTPASFGLSNRPTITVPPAQTAYQNVDQSISGIVIGDAPSATLTVTLGVGHGTLTLGTTSGLKVTGNGSGTVTLTGTTAALNAALASLVYRGDRNYSGGETLSLTAIDGGVSATPASVAITVESIAQEAADLQAQVGSLQAAGVLNQGQANSLIAKLDLKGNNGDLGKVQAFLNEVAADLSADILTQAQADALLYWDNILVLSVMRR
jgi:hypothetical protein